jgi:hypothetical protein
MHFYISLKKVIIVDSADSFYVQFSDHMWTQSFNPSKYFVVDEVQALFGTKYVDILIIHLRTKYQNSRCKDKYDIRRRVVLL